MFLFGLPWGFLGLFSVLALVGIYFLLGRAKPRQVSALFLWDNQPVSPRAGKRWEKLRTPLLFFLELAALIFLTLALTQPGLLGGQGRIPLVVVLDNSYSMTAGGETAPRFLGQDHLEDLLRSQRYGPVNLILAGAEPRLLGPLDRSDNLTDRLADWTCHETNVRPEKALVPARRLGGPKARILVISDHPSQNPPGEDVLWLGFGRDYDNMALVNAARGIDGDQGWVMVEVANFAKRPAQNQLNLIVDGNPTGSRPLNLAADETQRLVFNMPADAGLVTLKLQQGDQLPLDDQVVLAQPDQRFTRVRLDIRDQTLRDQISRALTGSRRTQGTEGQADLLISDRTAPPKDDGNSRTWVLSLVNRGEGIPLAGPFIRDARHPLMNGLSFRGSIWGVPENGDLSDAGLPVLMAGNRTLISDQADGDRRLLRMLFVPTSSRIQREPVWPAFFWNLLEWRAQAKPGLNDHNPRLGGRTLLSLPAPDTPVTIIRPSGERFQLTPPDRLLTLRADEPGVFQIQVGDLQERFAVNAMDAGESDLRAAKTDRQGEWVLRETNTALMPLLPWLILLTLLLLAWHQWEVSRRQGRI